MSRTFGCGAEILTDLLSGISAPRDDGDAANFED